MSGSLKYLVDYIEEERCMRKNIQIYDWIFASGVAI